MQSTVFFQIAVIKSYHLCWGLIVIFFISCGPSEPDRSTIQTSELSIPAQGGILKPDTVIDSWNDSVFISWCNAMSASDSAIYVSDYSANRILVLDKDYNLSQILGQTGKGPGDFLGPRYVHIGHQFLTIYDLRNARLNQFSKAGKYLKSIPFPNSIGASDVDGRIAVNSSSSFFISVRDIEGSIVHLEPDKGIINRFGPQRDEGSYEIRSSHLFMTENQDLISVQIMNPILEKYSLEGDLIERLDLSTGPLLENILKHKDIALKREYERSPLGMEIITYIFNQVSYHNNRLFIMSSDLPEEDIGTDEEINLNRVLEFSVYPKFEFTNEYVLEMDEEEQI